MRFVKVFLFIFIIIVSLTQAQDSLNFLLPELIISVSKRPVLFSELTRTVDQIKYSTISELPVSNTQEILSYSSGVDLKKRGPNGVQSDLSIRGGTFEQTLVMIDGIKLIDPQTGHHNLNLPLTRVGLESVEIVKGGSSTIHGPNAFTGAVNYITTQDRLNRIKLIAEGGENGYFSGSILGSYNISNINNTISFDKYKSDGYLENTEFDITNFSYDASLVNDLGIFDFYLGYTKRDFGANSFYTTRFPLQAEKISTKFVKIGIELGDDKLNFSLKGYWRGNDDEFVLDKTNPAFYKNTHSSNTYGSELTISFNSSLGRTSVGGELILDDIESSNLGSHKRNKGGIFLEQRINLFESLNLSFSGYAYNYSFIGWKFWPGIAAGYGINRNLRFYFNFSKAFRIPTYTELYYNDPITKGNIDLRYEETYNMELGTYYDLSNVTFSASIFRRDGFNLIDWIRLNEEDKWTAMNISDITTYGFEGNISFALNSFWGNQPLKSLSFYYTYLTSTKERSEFESRYLLDYLKHQIHIALAHELVWNIEVNWFFRFNDRINLSDYTLIDLKIAKQFELFNLYLSATNLFNRRYEDIPDVIMPGRWIIGGIKFSFQ